MQQVYKHCIFSGRSTFSAPCSQTTVFNLGLSPDCKLLIIIIYVIFCIFYVLLVCLRLYYLCTFYVFYDFSHPRSMAVKSRAPHPPRDASGLADSVRLFTVTGYRDESGVPRTRKKTYAPVLSINMGNLAPMPFIHISPHSVSSPPPRRIFLPFFHVQMKRSEERNALERTRRRNRWKPPVQVSIAYEVHCV
jgi:hypothetical protein